MRIGYLFSNVRKLTNGIGVSFPAIITLLLYLPSPKGGVIFHIRHSTPRLLQTTKFFIFFLSLQEKNLLPINYFLFNIPFKRYLTKLYKIFKKKAVIDKLASPKKIGYLFSIFFFLRIPRFVA